MEHNRPISLNLVPLIFATAIIIAILGIVIATFAFNQIPQPQPTDPAFVSQAQQPGYLYNDAAATQNVHNRAFSILVVLGTISFVVIGGIFFLGSLANRKVSHQIAQLDQYAALTKTVHDYQEAYALNKHQTAYTNRSGRRTFNRHD